MKKLTGESVLLNVSEINNPVQPCIPVLILAIDATTKAVVGFTVTYLESRDQVGAGAN